MAEEVPQKRGRGRPPGSTKGKNPFLKSLFLMFIASNFVASTRGSTNGAARVGEPCATDADCYDNKKCAGGTCCAFDRWDSGYLNCTDCSYNATKNSSYYMTQHSCNGCSEGNELYFQYGYGAPRCRRICDTATEYLQNPSYDSYCSQKKSAGSSCDEDIACISGQCGDRYCCDEAKHDAYYCTLCSASTSGYAPNGTWQYLQGGDCLERSVYPPPSPPVSPGPPIFAKNITDVKSPPPNLTSVSPPPPNATAMPSPPPSSPPPNRLIFSDYESFAARYSVLTALLLSTLVWIGA